MNKQNNQVKLTDKTKNVMYYFCIVHPDPNYYTNTMYTMSLDELNTAQKCVESIINKQQNKPSYYNYMGGKEYDYPTELSTMGTDELRNFVKDIIKVKIAKKYNLKNPNLQEYKYVPTSNYYN